MLLSTDEYINTIIYLSALRGYNMFVFLNRIFYMKREGFSFIVKGVFCCERGTGSRENSMPEYKKASKIFNGTV